MCYTIVSKAGLYIDVLYDRMESKFVHQCVIRSYGKQVCTSMLYTIVWKAGLYIDVLYDRIESWFVH